MTDNSLREVEKVHPLLNGDVVMEFSNGVVETILRMAGERSSLNEMAFTWCNWRSDNDLSVSIDIQHPEFKGQIRYHFSKEVVKDLFKKIFNNNIEPSKAEIDDCLGEISNICSGHAKAKLNLKGYSLKLGIPSRAINSQKQPRLFSSLPNIIIPFKIFNKFCHMQIILS